MIIKAIARTAAAATLALSITACDDNEFEVDEIEEEAEEMNEEAREATGSLTGTTNERVDPYAPTEQERPGEPRPTTDPMPPDVIDENEALEPQPDTEPDVIDRSRTRAEPLN